MSDEMDKGMPFITKAIIVAIMAVIIIILAAGISFYVATKAVKTSSTKTEASAGQAEEGKKIKIEVGPMIKLGEQTINLNEAEIRYLMFELTLEIEKTKNAEKNIAEVEEKKVIILDRVLSIVKNKTVLDISTDKDFVKLKREIIAGINPFLEKAKVKNIYFGKWLIQ